MNPSRKGDLFALPILLILVSIPFLPVVFGGKAFFYTDTFNFFYPLKKTVMEFAGTGALPHWNHLSAGGKPLIGGLQSGAFYPLNFVMGVLPFHRGFQVFIVIHYLLAAALAYRLGRRMGLGPPAAFLTGLTYALSGHLVSMANSMSILMVAAWLPLQVQIALDLTERRRWSDLALLALVTSIAFLAGAPVTFAYTAGTVVILLLVGLIRRARRRESWVKGAALTAAFPLLVFGVCAVQFLPAADFASLSIRAEGVPFDDAAKYSLHPLRLATFVSPYLFGNHAVDLPYRWQVAPQIIILITIYVGVLPLLLAPVAFLGPSRRPTFWAWALLISIIIALGRHLPIYRILYEVVPFFEQFRSPFKALVIATFSFSLLAGFGLQNLLDPDGAGRKARTVLLAGLAWGIVLGAALAVSFHLYGRIEASDPAAREGIEFILERMIASTARGAVVLAGAAALLFVATIGSSWRQVRAAVIVFVAVVDLVWSTWSATPLKPDSYFIDSPDIAAPLRSKPIPQGPFRVYRSPPDEWAGREKYEIIDQDSFYEMRRMILAPNYGTVFDIEQFDSYESAVLFWHSKFQNYLERASAEERPRMMGLFNIRFIISSFRLTSDWTIYPRQTLMDENSPKPHPPWFFRNRLEFPRAYFVPEAIETVDGNEMLLRIGEDREIDFTRTVLVTPPGRGRESLMEEKHKLLPYDPNFRPSALRSRPWEGPDPVPLPAGSITYQPNEVKVAIDAPQPGFLVLNDTYHPDWRAWVNGEEVDVRRANYLVRAVEVPSGPSTVIFRFEPRFHRIGMAISLFTLFLLPLPVLFMLGIPILGRLVRRGPWKGQPPRL